MNLKSLTHNKRDAVSMRLKKAFPVLMEEGIIEAMDLPDSLIWLWREYDPSKTSQDYEMEPSEREKPLYRVRIANRDAW